jgi:hypothetical protein
MAKRLQFQLRTLILLAVVVALAGYPLSLGPIEYLAWHDLLPKWSYRRIEVIYWPLLFLFERVGARDALDWYLSLWRF